MPREAKIERTYICTEEGSTKSYSYQSGLCIHIREKHPEKHLKKVDRVYEKRLGRLANIVSTIDFNLDEIISSKEAMKSLISNSEIVHASLSDGNFSKRWMHALVSILKDKVVIDEGDFTWGDGKVTPCTETNMRTLVENFITCIDEYVFQNIHLREGWILRGAYDINEVWKSLPHKIHLWTRHFKKTAERQMRPLHLESEI